MQGDLDSKTEVICYNVLGDIVYKETILPDNSVWNIDLTLLPKGIYSIQFINISGSTVKKFIKK